jgi:hypothetical protein
LREYSIPHLRRSGRISIPEESFDRIREARDLHKEGLGTESVRRVLREGRSPGSGELTQRLDHLHETLEDLRGNVHERPTTAEAALPSPTLRTILARQSLLISAVFNLTEMVEELLLASGKPRKVVFGDVEDEIRQQEIPEGTAPATRPAPRALPRSVRHDTRVRTERFGSLSQRRRRGALAVLSALVMGVLLAWTLPVLGGEPASEFWILGGRQAEEGSRNVPAGGQDSQAAENGGGAAVGGAVGATVGSRPPGPEGAEEVEVPDVSDRGLEEATRILSGAGFIVVATKTEASLEEAGTAMGTEPSAGSAADPGSPVTLIVSGGPGWVPPGTPNADSGSAAAAQYGD